MYFYPLLEYFLPIHVTSKGGISIVIECAIVGAIGLISISSTNNHNFF